MTNFYTVDKVINGKTYKAQFNGLSQKYKMRNQCKAVYGGVVDVDEEKMTQYILDNVIVEPQGLNIDDFVDGEEMDAVIEFGIGVMNGQFRNSTDKAGAGKAGKE